MKNETLYINDEKFGSVSYVGTWDQFRKSMEPAFQDWYKDYCNNLASDLYQEIDEDDATPMPYEEWVEQAMEGSLSEASDEEIANHERLSE